MARLRLGDLLIKAGLIDEMQLNSALSHQKKWGGRLGDILVDLGFLDEMMLWKGLSKQLGVPLVSLATVDLDIGLTRAFPQQLATRHEVFPIRGDDRGLTIATADPGNVVAIDEIAFQTGKRIKIVLAPPREIGWALNRAYLGVDEACPPPRERRHLSVEGDAVEEEPIPLTGFRSPPMTPEPLRGRPPAPNFGSARYQQPPARGPTPAPAAPFAMPPTGAGSYGAPTDAAPGLVNMSTPLEALGHVAAAVSADPALEKTLRQTTRLLRQLVDACVQRGIFTREEYLARVRQLTS